MDIGYSGKSGECGRSCRHSMAGRDRGHVLRWSATARPRLDHPTPHPCERSRVGKGRNRAAWRDGMAAMLVACTRDGSGRFGGHQSCSVRWDEGIIGTCYDSVDACLGFDGPFMKSGAGRTERPVFTSCVRTAYIA